MPKGYIIGHIKVTDPEGIRNMSSATRRSWKAMAQAL